MGFYKWTPSKTAKREFAKKMAEIDEFCKKNNLQNKAILLKKPFLEKTAIISLL